jgi:hypothetical protein
MYGVCTYAILLQNSRTDTMFLEAYNSYVRQNVGPAVNTLLLQIMDKAIGQFIFIHPTMNNKMLLFSSSLSFLLTTNKQSIKEKCQQHTQARLSEKKPF